MSESNTQRLLVERMRYFAAKVHFQHRRAPAVLENNFCFKISHCPDCSSPWVSEDGLHLAKYLRFYGGKVQLNSCNGSMGCLPGQIRWSL